MRVVDERQVHTDRPVDPSKLVAKARRLAELAVDDYRAGNDDPFALHAGVCLEALSKALLAEENPVLLLELGSKSRASLLHLTGVKQDPGSRRTAAAREAF